MERSQITGILLAGGKSSRMGQEKGLVQFRNRPMIQIGIDLLSNYADRLLISSGNPEYDRFGLELVRDQVSGQGPAAGLAAALRSATTPWCLVVACDLPFLRPELIDGLLDHACNCQAVLPVHDGVAEPLAALYHRDLFEVFEKAVAGGNLALNRILASCGVAYYDAGRLLDQFPDLFVNFNTMEEMDRYRYLFFEGEE